MFHWFVLQRILCFKLFSVSPWQFVQKVQNNFGVGIGPLWNILPLSTQQRTLALLVVWAVAESTPSSPSQAHTLPVPQHLTQARLPSLRTMPTLLSKHTWQGRWPHPQKAGGILVSRAVHQLFSLHQVCPSPPVKSYLYAKWWYEAFSSMAVQLSVDSLHWNAAGESPDCLHQCEEHLPGCLQSPGREESWSQPWVCPGLLLPSQQDPARTKAFWNPS